MQRHAVHRSRHAMLAHAIVDIAAGGLIGGLRRQCLGLGEIGSGEIGGAAHQFRHGLGEHLERRLARLPRRPARPLSASKHRLVGVERSLHRCRSRIMVLRGLPGSYLSPLMPPASPAIPAASRSGGCRRSRQASWIAAGISKGG